MLKCNQRHEACKVLMQSPQAFWRSSSTRFLDGFGIFHVHLGLNVISIAINRYSIMTQCWKENIDERPDFITVFKMLSDMSDCLFTTAASCLNQSHHNDDSSSSGEQHNSETNTSSVVTPAPPIPPKKPFMLQQMLASQQQQHLMTSQQQQPQTMTSPMNNSANSTISAAYQPQPAQPTGMMTPQTFSESNTLSGNFF